MYNIIYYIKLHTTLYNITYKTMHHIPHTIIYHMQYYMYHVFLLKMALAQNENQPMKRGA